MLTCPIETLHLPTQKLIRLGQLGVPSLHGNVCFQRNYSDCVLIVRAYNKKWVVIRSGKHADPKYDKKFAVRATRRATLDYELFRLGSSFWWYPHLPLYIWHFTFNSRCVAWISQNEHFSAHHAAESVLFQIPPCILTVYLSLDILISGIPFLDLHIYLQ